MHALTESVRRHPLPWYFGVTFFLSWAAIVVAVLAVTGGLSPTPEQFQLTIPVTVPAMLLGPAAASLVLTGIVSGRAGYRDLWSRLRVWRVDRRWYLFALLVAPVTLAVPVLVLWLFSLDYAPRFVTEPDKAGTILMALAIGLAAGFLEEIGWTGFAIPKARQHYSVLWTGLLVGVLWGVWHFFVSYWGGGGTNGGVPLAIFMSFWVVSVLVGQLTAYRVLMVWVYEHTGSVLVAALMHASLAAFQFILNPLTPGVPQQVYPWGQAAATWVAVAAVALTSRGEMTGRRRFLPINVRSHHRAPHRRR
ncbi:CPBP family intramembrane glutamic endopeptidase [Arthrobacter sp. FW306-07-I]|uniref:CPBP family intramembrane glutamic endopeptidase n=1 Tax=Arthrobacter sp. FW306-07-I TaxID=2879622 RepID=UPI001F2423DC|nr:CPBP family intramembrane glutamic endopeptidase [Arthrobacter sp. FW306-07-I]UKA76404.1 CPBP family intramembrane metalloprotease [Arthrobacter sp. FW306-07-I]